MAYVGFEKLKASIAAKGGVRNPGAVAAAIGRKKYGKEKFQKAAVAGKTMRGMTPAHRAGALRRRAEGSAVQDGGYSRKHGVGSG